MSELEIRPLRLDEIDRFVALSHYSFSGRASDERAEDFGRRVNAERQVLVAVEGGEIVSQVMIYQFGIWIDGVRYSCGGLANVATVPEKTRRGYANQLLRAALAWMRDELGMSLSTLYATVYPLYHGLGWALAEDTHRYVGNPSSFRPNGRLPSDPGGRVTRRLANLDDVDLLEPIYRQFARGRTGYLDRPRWYWEDMVLRYRGATRTRWLGLWCGADGQLAGYVLYAMEGQPLGVTPNPELNVYELISLKPEGYQALLSFLAAHHLWSKVVIEGGRDVPWRSLVANPHQIEAQALLKQHFLLRVVDVQKAISQRQAPAGRPVADVTLRVRDEAAPWNHGVWLVGQRDGHWICEATPHREPDATIDVATLASLFSGVLGVRQAVDAGLLRAKDESRPTIEAVFGPTYPPHSVDFF